MRALAILALMILAPCAPAEIFRHLDKHGKVVFTDQPPENAEQVTLPKANVMNMDPNARDAASRFKQQDEAARNAPPPATEGYSSLRVVGAPDGQQLQNPTEPITVAAKAEPPLRPGDTLVIRHNGETANPDGADSVTFERIDRGEHTFVAEIRNANGEVLISSPPMTFNVQRTTIIRQH